MKRLLWLILSHCSLIFGSSFTESLEEFADDLLKSRIEESLFLLDKMEEEYWQNKALIKGLRATVLLSKGELQESSILMAESISMLEESYLSEQLVLLIRDLYEKA
ncbi:hypothetical protein [Simkania negevensis]|uniref:Uncharacterized protein n=1 Tax=Simkania negevensis (strain ATCC VR-1471 / DSM 27360 / Z) TaxID=331113 RepID=F8L5C0_SIMNZ|nr:hypothetical protein [Simkania negevensis]CCB88009.1 unknown protein [Simkania negevensis Z]